jgi:hypothetical protein
MEWSFCRGETTRYAKKILSQRMIVELLFCKTAIRILSNQRVLEYEFLHAVIRGIRTCCLGWKKTETKRIQKGDGRDNGFFLAEDCRGLVVVPRGTENTIWKLLWGLTPKYAGSIQEDNNMSNRQESATRNVAWSTIREIELSMFSWTSSCPRTE